MNAARIVIVAVLLPLGITGALVLSAGATIHLFASRGVPVAWAAVGMLEVTSLAGTLLWVLVENRSLRRDAILVTCGATGVVLIAGVVAYGPVGAVPGALLVVLTHVASKAWREPWTQVTDRTLPSGAGEPVLDDNPSDETTDKPDGPEPARHGEPPAASTTTVGSFDDAVQWAVGELRAGRTAGWKRISNHSGLAESPSRRASARAKELNDARPPLRVAGQ